jgi:hypothetical protein
MMAGANAGESKVRLIFGKLNLVNALLAADQAAVNREDRIEKLTRAFGARHNPAGLKDSKRHTLNRNSPSENLGTRGHIRIGKRSIRDTAKQ